MRSVAVRVAAIWFTAACGAGAVAASPPSSRPPPASSATAATPSASTATAPTPDAPPSTALPAAMSPFSPPVEMKAPVASAMLADLEGLALDSKNLPTIERLDPKALRGVMKLIARSLGAKCGDCHLERDFAARTPRKLIAAKMWDEFVVKLAFAADGAALFCDSCHQGRTRQLDRSDKKILGKWMAANFVEKLKRKDEKDHECETCHVDMDMRFLSKWGGGDGF
jgi:cytochrome c7-like protein